MLFYSTPADVIRFTGVRPEDFGMVLQGDLEMMIQGWLVEAKDLIDQDRNRNYHAEVSGGARTQIPPGIHNIAMRIVANMVALAVMHRETPVVRVDDFSIRLAEDKIFTEAIRQDLNKYPAIPRFRMFRVRPTTVV